MGAEASLRFFGQFVCPLKKKEKGALPGVPTD